MKFCDKLSALRRQNNMSQEQLADKLGVSRQAVSKWESGSSVPDMEKMMQLCKFLNCGLDELVDDDAIGNKKINFEEKTSWSVYYKEVLEFITKTLNMFWSMRLVEKVKCLLEMLFLAILCWFILMVAGNIVHSTFYPILSFLPENIYRVIYSISEFVYNVFGIIANVVILVHIFKMRYLDYFITIEDGEATEKRVEIPIEEIEQPKKEEPRKFIEKKKNKIIIRDSKHSTYSFFEVLAKMVIWFIKFLLLLFAIPCIICFIAISFFGICSLWYVKDGLFFLGTTLALVGCLMVNYLVLKMIYYFILEVKYSFQKVFLLFMIGLLLIGGGAGISFCTYLTFDKVKFSQKDIMITQKEITYEDNMVLLFIEDENIKVIEDNTIENIKLDIIHYSKMNLDLYRQVHYTNRYGENYLKEVAYVTYGIDLYSDLDDMDEVNYLLRTIQDKKRIDHQIESSYQITITCSSEVLEKLKNNYQKFYEVEYDY